MDKAFESLHSLILPAATIYSDRVEVLRLKGDLLISQRILMMQATRYVATEESEGV